MKTKQLYKMISDVLDKLPTKAYLDKVTVTWLNMRLKEDNPGLNFINRETCKYMIQTYKKEKSSL